MCCIFAGDSMLIMRSHGVSTAVKRNAAEDITQYGSTVYIGIAMGCPTL